MRIIKIRKQIATWQSLSISKLGFRKSAYGSEKSKAGHCAGLLSFIFGYFYVFILEKKYIIK